MSSTALMIAAAIGVLFGLGIAAISRWVGLAQWRYWYRNLVGGPKAPTAPEPTTLFGRIKRYVEKSGGFGVPCYPVTHNFPNLGGDGEVTINCIVTPSARPLEQYPSRNKQLDDGGAGVAAKCVGALILEVDELGLRIKWKPGQLGEQGFLSPFEMPRAPQHRDKPDRNRGDDRGVDPAQDIRVDSHRRSSLTPTESKDNDSL